MTVRPTARLVVVSGDDRVGNALIGALGEHGWPAHRKRRGADLLTSHRDFDVAILDLGVPENEGILLLRRLRQVSAIPVMVLLARDSERLAVRCLRGGADDCMVRPPRRGELLARLEKLSRRVADGTPTSAVLVAGDVRIDLAVRRVEVAGVAVPLTRTEFELLRILLERPDVTISRQQLMDRLWGDAFVAVSKSLYVHICGLRAKLDRPGLISTVRGYGYRWNTPA
ncbi:response regulator transcription factor [Nocardia sp. NPDC050712]|uniref:response regulator transcription factor n=1 Tax=Nocardia sp. NPDC050712 TaxID=3155518 RepID=UPI0033F8F5D5